MFEEEFFIMATEPVATVDAEKLPTENIETDNSEPLTLSAIFADALRAKKEQKATGFQQQNKPNHHKTPNRPPHGTRRSMGMR